MLTGGAGRDLLLGGSVADLLDVNGNQDILIAGTCLSVDEAAEVNLAALNAVMAEWTRGLSVQARIDHLTGASTGGLNGAFLLNDSTVFGDDDIDSLLDADGVWNWFLVSPEDVVNQSPVHPCLGCLPP